MPATSIQQADHCRLRTRHAPRYKIPGNVPQGTVFPLPPKLFNLWNKYCYTTTITIYINVKIGTNGWWEVRTPYLLEYQGCKYLQDAPLLQYPLS